MSSFDYIVDIQKFLYQACNLKTPDLIAEDESKDYYAYYYTIDNKHIRFRIAKKTPTKSGHFVTMWKRIKDGTIQPYDQSDHVDFFIVNIAYNDKIGQFIFPKSILVEKNIFSKNKNGGKRAIRVYSPWDITTNRQAITTKEWQKKYFLNLTSKESIDMKLFKRLLS